MDDVLPPADIPRPNNLDAYWVPFTPNRQFKKDPRLIVSAKGMYYGTIDGRQVMDGIAGLWCVNAGHGREKIIEAIQRQAARIDYPTAFQMSHPLAFDLAARLAALAPGDLDHVFFSNSGSEAVDTALKVALSYHKARGEGGRTRLIGRVNGYHGVGFGGTSVGGMVANRKQFGHLLAGVDHLPFIYDRQHMAYSKGQPDWGAHFADALEDLCKLHDPSTIAAVIVEPMAGSAGVYAPPKGYLERLRQICDQHGILLIFDEVITGFGRTGAAFASEKLGVIPDMMTTAKGITNGAVPMGATFVRKHVYDAFMHGPEHLPELFHGYTYSAHPLACAASMATLDIYQEEGLFQRVADLAPYWEEAVHSLKGAPHVVDIRNWGLVAGVELDPGEHGPGRRAFSVFLDAYENGILMRSAGNTMVFTPPLIIEKAQIDQMVDMLRTCLGRAK